MKKKKLKLKFKILFALILSIVLIYICLRYIGTNGLITKEYKIVDNNLPNSFYGLKIIHFTDLHFKTNINEKKIKNLIDEINKNKPDIVFFTGDLIDRNTSYTNDIENMLIQYLNEINSTYGKYYVTGNHDNEYYSNIMEKSGFISLDNNYNEIYSKDNEKILISGLSIYEDYTLIDKVIEENEYKYKIAIMHYPDYFDNIYKYNFNLVLSGHSHNGQVRLPYIGSIIKVTNAKKYYEPYYKINNTNFYISGGIGNSILDIRLFNKPSINMYRIVNENNSN